MRQLIDKIIIMVLCIICFYEKINDSQLPVVLILVALIVSVMNFGSVYINKKAAQIIRWIINLGYAFLCLNYPEFIFLFPLIIYDYGIYKLYPLFAAAIVCIGALYNTLGIHNAILTVALATMAVLVSYKTVKCQDFEKEIVAVRDEITEKNLRLILQNQELIEKKDYEINLATLKERNRIAGDIHDNVGHMLSRSILQVGALLAVSKDDVVHNGLMSVRDTLNQAMTSIRTSVHDLHEDAIDISQAISDATAFLPDNYKTTVECDHIKDMPQNIKYCFIAAVKESISNIVKHSNADEVTVILREHPAFYQLLIKDNGKVTATTSTHGMGLENMRQRVIELDGTFNIDTTNGFHIFISVKNPKHK